MKEFMMKHPIISCCMFSNVLGAIVTIVGLITLKDGSTIHYESGLYDMVKRTCKAVKEAGSDVKSKVDETKTEETEDEVTE